MCPSKLGFKDLSKCIRVAFAWSKIQRRSVLNFLPFSLPNDKLSMHFKKTSIWQCMHASKVLHPFTSKIGWALPLIVHSLLFYIQQIIADYRQFSKAYISKTKSTCMKCNSQYKTYLILLAYTACLSPKIKLYWTTHKRWNHTWHAHDRIPTCLLFKVEFNSPFSHVLKKHALYNEDIATIW